MRTRHRFGFVAALSLVACLLTPFGAAWAADDPEPADDPKPETLRDALGAGTLSMALRYRIESVSDDAVPSGKDAFASTLRTDFSYKTAPYKGVHFLVEAENVATVGNELFRNAGAGSASNGVTDRPVVADPALTELNQAFVAIERGKTNFKIGRQEMVIGDARFVGNVGWRQNHQSFDAFSLSNRSHEKVTFSYTYVDSVNRIFGDSKDMSSHLANARIGLGKARNLTVYGYLLDFDRIEDSARSTLTLGAELSGKKDLADGKKLLYELEYAAQSDAGDNTRDIRAEYLNGLLGAALDRVTVKVGWERLEHGGRLAFQTPLATLHKFNGWADKFLSTPNTGLEDIYLQLAGKVRKIGWTVFYHDFSATRGGSSYGQELDFQATYRAPWEQVFGFKAALYDADRFAADTNKLMLWTTYKF